MKRPSALFLDIDGTILRNDHSLSPRVAKGITALMEAGTIICLATGRSWEGLKPFYDRLGLKGPTVCYNGAFLVGGPEGDRLHEINMDEQVGRTAIKIARSRGLEFVAFRHTQLVIEKVGPFVGGYYQRNGLNGQVVNFDSFEKLEFTKALIISDHESLVPIKAELEAEFGPDRLSSTFSDPTFLELMGSGVDKGRGLRDVCRLTGIDVADSVAMGDGWNDQALLEAAGDAWVMGGAPDELKAMFSPDRQAPHSDVDGAAVIMEAMLEEREPDFDSISDTA